MYSKEVGMKLKLEFDDTTFSPYEFANYYDGIDSLRNYRSENVINTIDKYFTQYASDDCDYVDECYEQCPEEIQERMTRLIIDFVLDTIKNELNRSSNLKSIPL